MAVLVLWRGDRLAKRQYNRLLFDQRRNEAEIPVRVLLEGSSLSSSLSHGNRLNRTASNPSIGGAALNCIRPQGYFSHKTKYRGYLTVQ